MAGRHPITASVPNVILAPGPPSRTFELETGQGRARVHLHLAEEVRGALVLGHGAGGGVAAPDLLAAAAAAASQGLTVALVEQPYRVAGRRAPAPAARLDAAWSDVVDRLRQEHLAPAPLVVGGRSLGARVACRTADELGAAGVVCLAFPLLPPTRTGSKRIPESRLQELEAVLAPVLVVQGENDRFGMPPPGPGRTVIEIAGDHSLRTDVHAVSDSVGGWLARLLDGGL